MTALGATDYRNGAMERLEEAGFLLRQERWAGTIYLAGRAVEGMLRAVLWKKDAAYATGKKTLGTGHDLRKLLKWVRNLGVLRDQDLGTKLGDDVQLVASRWLHDMRFWPTTKVMEKWLKEGVIGGRRTMKEAAEDYYNACSAILTRCEAIWRS
jgi:hypothetical protein